MEPIVLEPKPGISPAEIASVLEQSGLKDGGEVFIKRLRALDDKAWNGLLVVALLAVAVIAGLKRRQEANEAVRKAEGELWSQELLSKLYDAVPDLEALEREIEERTGVEITVEDEEWPTPGMVLLNRAYGDDEIDISGIELKEPNPDYRP